MTFSEMIEDLKKSLTDENVKELSKLTARMTKMLYEALKEEGFDHHAALYLTGASKAIMKVDK